MTFPTGDSLVALVTLLLVVVTVASIVATWLISKGQEKLQDRLAAQQVSLQKSLATQQASLQKGLAAQQTAIQERISAETKYRHAEQRLYEQRTQLLPIWAYLSNLDEITSESPQTDIIKTVNTLELVAVCTEAQIIDEAVVLRTFRDKFIKLFEAVSEFGPLEGYDRVVTGKTLLAESPAATQLYLRLIAERNNRDKPRPL